MLQENVIHRRDLEPLWLRAAEIAQYYERAANCISTVMGADYLSGEPSKHPKTVVFCSLCKQYNAEPAYLRSEDSGSEAGLADFPCSQMHCTAVKKARELGGSYVYTCPAGIFFWTSPFFAGERFAGTLVSSAISENEKQETLDKLFTMYKGNISRAEIARHIDEMPAKTSKEVQALAQMLQLCAQHISSGESPWYNTRDKKHEHICSDRTDMNCLQNDREIDCAQPGIKSFDTGEKNILPKQPTQRLIDLMDKERLLLANLRRGDNAEAQKTTNEILKDLNAISGENFDLFKFKIMELVVLLSRSGTDSQNAEEISDANSRFLLKIDDSKTVKEVTDNLYLIIEQMAGQIFSFRGIRHSSALRKAERFIWENYTKKISLKEVADSSKLSSSYFSTIFKNEMGENFSNYLNRLRVEKASLMLRETEIPIKEISAACGFADQSWFSKIFKNFTGISPCKYRETGGVSPHGFRINEDNKK